MEKTYKIKFVEQTPIITVDGKFVFIDTGSPKTISEKSSFRFMGEDHNIQTSLKLARLGGAPHAMTISRLREMLQHDVSTKLGMDMIGKYHVLFDYRASKVTFSDKLMYLDADLYDMPLRRNKVVPVLDFVVQGRTVRCICDTGASCGFLAKHMVRAGRFLRKEDAKSTMAGDFDASIYQVQVCFGNGVFDAECFEMDDTLAKVTAMKGAEGLMGYDFFYNHRVLLGDGMMGVMRCEQTK